MPKVQLIQLDPSVEQSLANDAAYIDALVHEDWAQAADIVVERVGRVLMTDPVSVDKLQWDGYFVVDQDTRELVGSCAFTSPPTSDGTVEIAYFTFPEFERRGYATAMAQKLVELASRSDDIHRVIAHTLPETNASTRVLESTGMSFDDVVTDPEDGSVWRWSKRVGGSQ